jgi:hypothetical protein
MCGKSEREIRTLQRYRAASQMRSPKFRTPGQINASVFAIGLHPSKIRVNPLLILANPRCKILANPLLIRVIRVAIIPRPENEPGG